MAGEIKPIVKGLIIMDVEFLKKRGCKSLEVEVVALFFWLKDKTFKGKIQDN